MSHDIHILPVTHIGEIPTGADLGTLIHESLGAQGLSLEAGDILVITQKIVSKAEGKTVDLTQIEPSPFALDIATQYNKDARHVEVVLRESKRIVRMDRGVVISETRHGFICANAGVDESNVNGAHLLTLLPDDPDGSAQQIRASIQTRTGLEIAVIISDTWGRAWRNGQVNMAIGSAGIDALTDYRGQVDPYGYELHASIIAVADELASAAELVMGKIDRVPVALIRGYQYQSATGGIHPLLRDGATDMFR